MPFFTKKSKLKSTNAARPLPGKYVAKENTKFVKGAVYLYGVNNVSF